MLETREVHQYYGSEPYWGDSYARRDDVGAGAIAPASSDAPEAGGLKL